jgi:hypothetical protein
MARMFPFIPDQSFYEVYTNAQDWHGYLFRVNDKYRFSKSIKDGAECLCNWATNKYSKSFIITQSFIITRIKRSYKEHRQGLFDCAIIVLSDPVAQHFEVLRKENKI